MLVLTYAYKNLVNGASRAMNVNGLITNQLFKFQPPAGEVWLVERLLFGLDDVGLTDMALFGGIAVLTNGILVTASVGGTVYTVGTIFDNADVAMMFPGQLASASGVLDSADGIYGGMAFQEQVRLKGDDNDYIGMTVRDNLSLINIMRATAVAKRLI